MLLACLLACLLAFIHACCCCRGSGVLPPGPLLSAPRLARVGREAPAGRQFASDAQASPGSKSDNK
ncbi:hypothetical protein IF2G_01986 [Cordyceps javanica]|nr:hypothetical protein IF2G_01986 [Cordyceps javanica]